MAPVGPTEYACFETSEVMRGHNDVVANAKGDVDPLPIGGRCARSIAVLLVELLERPLHDGPLPLCCL